MRKSLGKKQETEKSSQSSISSIQKKKKKICKSFVLSLLNENFILKKGQHRKNKTVSVSIIVICLGI